jgi:hypothetical protein
MIDFDNYRSKKQDLKVRKLSDPVIDECALEKFLIWE